MHDGWRSHLRKVMNKGTNGHLEAITLERTEVTIQNDGQTNSISKCNILQTGEATERGIPSYPDNTE